MEMRKYDKAIVNCLPYDVNMVSLDDISVAEDQIPDFNPNNLSIFDTKVLIDSSNIVNVDTLPSMQKAFSYNIDDKICCAFLDIKLIVKTLREKYGTKADIDVMVTPEVAPYAKQSVMNNSDIHIISPVLKAYDENDKFRGYLGRIEIMENNEESEDF